MSTWLDPADPCVRLVSAPAGSGKTTLLVRHYLRHLARTSADRIVAITFTRKAAAELVSRISRALAVALAPPGPAAPALAPGLTPERARQALAALGSAPIMTVDGFALSLVQEFALDAHFEVEGGLIPIDGPAEGGADTGWAWRAAARARLEELSPDARVLLAQMTLGEATRSLASLARSRPGEGPTLKSLLEALGAALAPHVSRARAQWRAEGSDALAPQLQETVARWLETPSATPPPALLASLASVTSEPLRAARREALRSALARHGFHLEGDLRWEEARLRTALKAWADPEAVEQADRVRAALLRLARATRAEALRAIAARGALGYDELLEAATALCRRPPPGLARRYDVLMVDELQDTNPAQLAFYRAFAGLRREAPVEVFFVGDARQSIYRFRHADPEGWRSLVREAERDGTRSELRTNHRSSRLLVDAQRTIFRRLAELGIRGVDPLDDLTASPAAESGRLDGNLHERPVVVVDAPALAQVDEHVLALFCDRISERWRSHPGETAAVLVRSWRAAAWAASAIQGRGLQAQLTGDRALLESRVATDLRLFLRALLDPSDDVAITGVLKHPSIGASDRALMRLRSRGSLGAVLWPQAVSSGLEDPDSPSLPARLAVLREARTRIGREPTADLLEWLIGTLRWRPLLAAGPDETSAGGADAALAQLEILLEEIRQLEGEQVDPHAALAALDPDRDGADADLPPVRLATADGVVTVTTVHAAKGLQFDHVALLEIHKEGSLGVETGTCHALTRRLDRALLGVSLDPRGGLERLRDPLAAIGNAIAREQAAEEGARLFYVGFTRAARSVTLGLRRSSRGLVAALRTLISERELEDAVVRCAPDATRIAAPEPRLRERTVRVRPLEAAWATPRGWTLARPSAAGLEASGGGRRGERALLRNARVVRGGACPPLPPELEKVDETLLGEVVHGWLAHWRFDGEARIEQALEFLEEQWTEVPASLAPWLVGLGQTLRDRLPGFGELLRHELCFEWPLASVAGDKLWAGRADLLVRLEDRRAMVLDFKAGHRAAEPGEIPGLRTYLPQLEAYRRMLEAASVQVVELGLVYVRGPSWVRLPLHPPTPRRSRGALQEPPPEANLVPLRPESRYDPPP